MKTLEFYFDYVSPAAYLAWTQLPRLAAATGAQVLINPAVLAQVLARAGLDAAELADLAAQPHVKEALKEHTQEAVERGVFGAPTFFVGEHMFWGQDRLDFVLEALQ